MPVPVGHRGSENPSVPDRTRVEIRGVLDAPVGGSSSIESDVLHATAQRPTHGQGTHPFGVGPKQLAGATLTTLTRPPTTGPWGQLQCRSGASWSCHKHLNNPMRRSLPGSPRAHGADLGSDRAHPTEELGNYVTARTGNYVTVHNIRTRPQTGPRLDAGGRCHARSTAPPSVDGCADHLHSYVRHSASNVTSVCGLSVSTAGGPRLTDPSSSRLHWP